MLPRTRARFVLPVLAAIALAFAAASSSGPAAIEWRASLDDALARASAEGELVLVHFGDGARPASSAMERDTFGEPRVIAAAQDFVLVRLDPAREPELFERWIGEPGALASCVLDPQGELVAVLAGYAGPERLASFLDEAREGRERLGTARLECERDPGGFASSYALAEIEAELGCRALAEGTWRTLIARARDVDEDDPATRGCLAASLERLARSLAERGRSTEARDALARARELDPDQALAQRARITSAAIAWTERRPADARELLEQALRIDPTGREAEVARLALARALHELGEDSRALESLRELLEGSVRGRIASEARLVREHVLHPPPAHQH